MIPFRSSVAYPSVPISLFILIGLGLKCLIATLESFPNGAVNPMQSAISSVAIIVSRVDPMPCDSMKITASRFDLMVASGVALRQNSDRSQDRPSSRRMGIIAAQF